MLNFVSQYHLRQHKKFLYWSSTYILSVLKIVSKYDLSQLNKLLFCRSTWSEIVLIKGLQTWLAPNQIIRVLVLELQPLCAEKGSKHDSRQEMKFVYFHRQAAYLCRIWGQKMTCANWSNSRIVVRTTDFLCWIKFPNMTRSEWWISCSGSQPTPNRCRKLSRNMTCNKRRNSCIWDRHALICAEYRLETWLAPTQERRILVLDIKPICDN